MRRREIVLIWASNLQADHYRRFGIGYRARIFSRDVTTTTKPSWALVKMLFSYEPGVRFVEHMQDVGWKSETALDDMVHSAMRDRSSALALLGFGKAVREVESDSERVKRRSIINEETWASLRYLGVEDFLISEVSEGSWVATVIVSWAADLIPWTLAPRSSRNDAIEAVRVFLVGLADLRERVLADIPPSSGSLGGLDISRITRSIIFWLTERLGDETAREEGPDHSAHQ